MLTTNLEENLHLAPLALEDDELEHKRRHVDDVPLQMKRCRTTSFSQIRDQPAAEEHLPYLVMALMTDGGGKHEWVSSPIRTFVERLFGKAS